MKKQQIIYHGHQEGRELMNNKIAQLKQFWRKYGGLIITIISIFVMCYGFYRQGYKKGFIDGYSKASDFHIEALHNMVQRVLKDRNQ